MIFAECEWRDWVNLEFPNKYRTGAEWELRVSAAKFGKSGSSTKRHLFKKHVCGKVPEMAMFVDAVTVEKQIPWYELEHEPSNQKYETYKLSP